MSPPATFSSECPRCGKDRMQTAYEADELIELLREGSEIEAYCASCDEHWQVSTEERADLVRSLSMK